MRTILAALAASLGAAALAPADDGDILSREAIAPEVPEPLRDALDSIVVERVQYESDGLSIRGYLAYPRQHDEPLPCLVFNRGGNRDFGAWTDERFASLAARTAEWGYVVFASNYRGAPGSEGQEEFGGADVHDVINAIEALDHLDVADTERIGMWGHSRGGMMTYLALMQTDRVDAAIVGAGLADAARNVELRPAMETNVFAELVPDWETNRDEALRDRSALRRVDELPDDVPILLVHGTADWRVDPRDSMDMAQALYAARKPFRLIMVEGADHGISEDRDTYQDAARAWLDKYVRDQAPPPNLEPHGS